MGKQKTTIYGRTTIEVIERATGRIKQVVHNPNMVVNAGLAFLAGALSGDEATPSNMKYIGVGTGTTAAAAADTALVTPALTRGAGTQSRTTTTTTNDTYNVYATIDSDDSYAITEAGLFDASSSGDMLCRQVFSAVNLTSDDSIKVTWDITFARVA